MTAKQPCIPDMLPIENLDWQLLAQVKSKAMLELGRYDGTLNTIINPRVLLSPLTSNEAVLSSKIEGTQVSLMEMMKHEAGEDQPDERKRNDLKEVGNYRRALMIAEKYLEDRPITLQLIRELHSMLMNDVRGGDKTPGQFRTEQNWIGPKGCTMEQARFIPPSPTIMNDFLQNLQNFIDSDYIDPLVQLAIIHAQFEIIHPFGDGNGRLGRMLIPLFLYQKKILREPVFYLSEYLEEADDEYRERLLAITDKGDWNGWIMFFLTAIQEQAKRNNEKAIKICVLYERMKPIFRDTTHSQYAQAVLDALFTKPIINSTDFMKLSNINRRGTANNILKQLLDSKLIMLLRSGSGRSPSTYVFPELFDIAEGKRIFGNIK